MAKIVFGAAQNVESPEQTLSTELTTYAQEKYFTQQYNPEQQAQTYKESYMDDEAIVEGSDQEASRIKDLHKKLPEEGSDSIQLVIEKVPGRDEQYLQYRVLARFPEGVQMGNSELAPYTEETAKPELVYLKPTSACVTHAIKDLLEEGGDIQEIAFIDKEDAGASIDTGSTGTVQYVQGKTSPKDYVAYALHGGFTAGYDISYPIPGQFVE